MDAVYARQQMELLEKENERLKQQEINLNNEANYLRCTIESLKKKLETVENMIAKGVLK
jgi:uncharacterized protein YlxW (UPF0749 family)